MPNLTIVCKCCPCRRCVADEKLVYNSQFEEVDGCSRRSPVSSTDISSPWGYRRAVLKQLIGALIKYLLQLGLGRCLFGYVPDVAWDRDYRKSTLSLRWVTSNAQYPFSIGDFSRDVTPWGLAFFTTSWSSMDRKWYLWHASVAVLFACGDNIVLSSSVMAHSEVLLVILRVV